MAESPRFSAWKHPDWIGALAFVLTGVGIYLFYTKGGQTQAPRAQQASATARAISVVTAKAKNGDMNVYLSGLGTVTPLNTVTVKSRVDGQLMRVMFREGQLVRAGDLLAEIDPRPFQVQLEQAERSWQRIKRCSRTLKPIWSVISSFFSKTRSRSNSSTRRPRWCASMKPK